VVVNRKRLPRSFLQPIAHQAFSRAVKEAAQTLLAMAETATSRKRAQGMA